MHMCVCGVCVVWCVCMCVSECVYVCVCGCTCVLVHARVCPCVCLFVCRGWLQNWKVFWNCADDILKTQSTLGQNYSIYIATEDACVKLEARRRYGCHAVFGIEPYSRENLQGLKNGLIDNFLLGEGDDIIVSGSSTYSNVAAARTWIVPHTVMNTPRLCVKLLHAEPVMHQWNEMLQAPDSHCIDPKEIDDMLNRDEFAWH